jgi:arabinose-5-phosphate isomerase
LGYQLSKVEDHMRPLEQCRLADESETVRAVLIRGSLPGRRTGATMLVDAAGLLSGIFTDSDLARLFERRRDQDLDRPVREVMTRGPLRVEAGAMMIDAVAIMARRKISELPVVDAGGRPIGLIDITDVVALLPKEAAASTMVSPPSATLRVVGAPETTGATAGLDCEAASETSCLPVLPTRSPLTPDP